MEAVLDERGRCGIEQFRETISGRRTRHHAKITDSVSIVNGSASPECHPCLESADEVGGTVEAELAECCGGEAGLVALVADDHDPGVVAVDLDDVVRADGVEAPFEHVAIDDDRGRQLAIACALFDRADVDDDRAGVDLDGE
ncbi:MAG: hypothetical protein R2695_21650 [Acidimicrobiales bacterium]